MRPTRLTLALVAALAVTLLAGSVVLSAPASAETAASATLTLTPAQNTAATRAEATYAALQRYFAVGDGTGLVREQFPVAVGDNPYSYEWPFSQVHVAALDLTGMPGARGAAHQGELTVRKAGQEQYWNAAGGLTGKPGYASGVLPPNGTGGDFFYDDNEWVGLADMQTFLASDDAASLRRAKQIFRLVVSGWDTDPTHAKPGGVFWTQASWSTDRNTVSNMPGAELGLRLYQVTHDPYYLSWATKMYDWTNRWLQRPDGLYADHLALDGTVEPTVWSYNQGVPVGVNVLFHEITHDPKYLVEAQRIATASMSYFVAQGRLDSQPAPFNAIFFKNLLLLDAATGSTQHRRAMADYADRLWRTVRNPATGLFSFSTPPGTTQAIEQAAMAQIYAVLAWSPSRWNILY